MNKKKHIFANDTEKYIYQRWLAMFERSFRGTSVCPDWQGKEGLRRFTEWALENGFKRELFLDRIDTRGDYSPENCRWVSAHLNSVNSLNTRFVYYHGEIRALPTLIKESGLPHSVVSYRLKHGWEIDDALNIPSYGKGTKTNTPVQFLNYDQAFGKCKDI